MESEREEKEQEPNTKGEMIITESRLVDSFRK